MAETDVMEYKEEDKDACTDLLKTTFPGTSDEQTFKWRFESPLTPKPLLICAKQDNKLVSFNSWIPWKFSFNLNTYLGYQSGESATHKDYRRKGIFSKILKYGNQIARMRNIGFLFGFPGRAAANAFYKAGYYPVATFNFYLRIISPLRKLLEKQENHDLSIFFTSRLTQTNKITPVFDSIYFQWRYLDNPKDYDIIRYEESNCHALFIIRKAKWRNIRELILLDCQFTSFNEVFVRNAFDYIDKLYSRKAVYMRTFFNENTHRGRAIRKHFHIRVKRKFEILILKPITEHFDYNNFLNYNNWDIMPHVIDDF